MPSGTDLHPARPPLNEPALSASDVAVRVSGKVILSGVSFEIERGTLTALVGPNGSGKTTLLRSISGSQPYEGRLELESREVRSYAPRSLARRLAYVRQSPVISFDYTVGELVRLGRSPHKGWLGGYDRHDEEHAARALSQVGLAGFEERSLFSLSGGELQRAFLAQALTQGAPLLLLDEPTAHLDVHYQFDLLQRLRELTRAGYTAVAVLHDLELAARFADHIIALDHGSVAADGPPAAVVNTDLLARVFRMQATVDVASGRVDRVRFESPIPSAATAP